ncbi:MAG TPA: DNA-directed RNA polymerase subunit omega [Candidatus Coprenecus stercoravium]|uniref:DNA-directed RNA polymerase subunit omega n=1 Tax=Candidatus Coprenecus stercoravium TaxID=2840735 RepID=A0A9D2GPC7_9BACT|nr:DNA-directed RNA polymerase subunit omega [Candidatus Coprenecus stercoravium]
MELKQVPTNTVTRNLSELAKPTGNIYESVMIIAKRANQISANVKQELSQKLEEFSNYADTLEETFENREQIEISKHYERLPKPTLIAVEEFRNGEIYYRKVDDQQ